MIARNATLLTTIASTSIVFGFSLKMLLDPFITEAPSLINCFSYLRPLEADAIYVSAVILSLGTIALVIGARRLAADFMLCLVILAATYFLLVAMRSGVWLVVLPGLVALAFLGANWRLLREAIEHGDIR